MYKGLRGTDVENRQTAGGEALGVARRGLADTPDSTWGAGRQHSREACPDLKSRADLLWFKLIKSSESSEKAA